MTRYDRDWETNTPDDAGLWERDHAPTRLEDALERGYTEPDSPETPAGRRGTPRDPDDLIARIGRQIEAERAAVRERWAARKHVMDTVAERLPG